MPRLLPERITHCRKEQGSRSCPAHRAWVRRHHCSVPGCILLPVECAHVRRGGDGGTGLKPSDCYAISLCRTHHAEQHRIGEPAFQTKHGLDLLALADEFAKASPHWRTLQNG